MPKTLLQGGTIITMNSRREILVGDVLIEDSEIKAIGKNLINKSDRKTEVIDVTNQFVIPGLIQTHTHLVQTIMRGHADDMSLLSWLKTRIWPMEAAHDSKSIAASAEMGLLEMSLLGTTTILDMATVRHTNELLETVSQSGMRYWGGKCLMDHKTFSGPLCEPTKAAIKETEDLIQAWDHKHSLVTFVICPRFAVSSTRKLLEACRQLQENCGLLVHTHASESREEIAVVKKRSGKNNIDYLNSLGLLNEKTVVVHGVHMTRPELKKMIQKNAKLVHCPSANLKLASGIAPIELFWHAGLIMGIGSDGAACNNTMDPFMEMRLAALIQKPKFGPEALPAQVAFELATLGGARVLGQEHLLGSVEVGKKADVVSVSREHPSVYTVEDPYAALVYSCSGRDVVNVFVDGKAVVRNKKHQIYDHKKVLETAKVELTKLLKRM